VEGGREDRGGARAQDRARVAAACEGERSGVPMAECATAARGTGRGARALITGRRRVVSKIFDRSEMERVARRGLLSIKDDFDFDRVGRGAEGGDWKGNTAGMRCNGAGEIGDGVFDRGEIGIGDFDFDRVVKIGDRDFDMKGESDRAAFPKAGEMAAGGDTGIEAAVTTLTGTVTGVGATPKPEIFAPERVTGGGV
jgi:hypothetical protein